MSVGGQRLRFRPSACSIRLIVLLHVGLWCLGSAVIGFDFVHIPRAAAIGTLSGMVHGVIAWLATSVTIEGGVLTTRQFLWSTSVSIDQITMVQVVEYQGLRSVAIRLVDDEQVTLAVPSQSMLAPNSLFSEELRRLCAAVLLHTVNDDSNFW